MGQPLDRLATMETRRKKREHPAPVVGGWERPEYELTSDAQKMLVRIVSEGDPRDGGSNWQLLRHPETDREVAINVQDPDSPDATIRAVLTFPIPGHGVASRDLRAFPVSDVQAHIRGENVAGEYSMKALNAAGWPSFTDVSDLSVPVPRGSLNDMFYARVALQHAGLTRVDDQPTKRQAEINGVSEATARRWLKEARDRKFLPPGKPGRRTKSSRPDDGSA